MAEAIKEGLADEGKLERITRAVYRLADLLEIGALDLLTVALRAPRSVVCLVSVLSFHNLQPKCPIPSGPRFLVIPGHSGYVEVLIQLPRKTCPLRYGGGF